MKKLVFALTALSLLAGSAPTLAAASPCRDTKGKFVKCPAKPTATAAKTTAKPKACRDAKGHFAKCK
jgi:hypothetical protein